MGWVTYDTCKIYNGQAIILIGNRYQVLQTDVISNKAVHGHRSKLSHLLSCVSYTALSTWSTTWLENIKFLIFSCIYCVMAKKLLELAKSTLVCSRNCKFLHVNQYAQCPYCLGIWLQNFNILKFFSIVFPAFIWHSVGRVILC